MTMASWPMTTTRRTSTAMLVLRARSTVLRSVASANLRTTFPLCEVHPITEGRSTPSPSIYATPVRTSACSLRTSVQVRHYRTSSPRHRQKSITVLGQAYPVDDYTNLTESISSRLTTVPRLPSTASHPLQLLSRQIQDSMPGFEVVQPPSPVVSVDDNFGSLGFPDDHPGRSPTDTYYVNRNLCLRTHTSTHEVQTFSKGHTKWLLTADVFRRDEIDASHYPIFHQMEGACIHDLDAFDEGGEIERDCQTKEQRLNRSKIEITHDVDLHEAGGFQATHEQDERKLRAAKLAMRHLKATLNNLVLDLFGDRHAADSAEQSEGSSEPLKVRWIAASFPFTSPSFEIEVLFRGKWLEILGCGVVMQKTLDNAKVDGKLGWAFGLGLERIAMVLFQIPDIRLFWSSDPRFISQFAASDVSPGSRDQSVAESVTQTGVSPAGGAMPPSAGASKATLPLITFKPYSRFPACYKDVSFWLPARSSDSQQQISFHSNDVFEIIRDIAGDLAEDVVLIDDFVHPKSGKQSKCFRINYRSMDRNLDNDEVNELHSKVTSRLVKDLQVELR